MLTINHQIALVNDLIRLRNEVNSFQYKIPFLFKISTRWPINYLDPPRNEAEYLLNSYLSYIWPNTFPIEKFKNRRENWKILQTDWAFFLLLTCLIILIITLILKSLCSFCNRLSKLCLYKRYIYKIKERVRKSINNLKELNFQEIIETAKNEIDEKHASCSCTAKASTTANKKLYFLSLVFLSMVFVSLLGFLNVMYLLIIVRNSKSFRSLNLELSGSFFNFINNFQIVNNSLLNRNHSYQQLTNLLEYKRNWTFITENGKLQTSLFYYQVVSYFFEYFEMKFHNFWYSTDISIGIALGLFYLTTVILLIPFSLKFYKAKKEPVDRTGFSHYTGVFLAILGEMYRILAAKLIILLLIPLLLGHFLNGLVCPIITAEYNKLENSSYVAQNKNKTLLLFEKDNYLDKYNKINCIKEKNQSIIVFSNYSYFNCSDLKGLASILSNASYSDIELNPKWFFTIWFRHMKTVYCIYLIDKFMFYASIWFFLSVLMIFLSTTLSFLSKFLMKPTFERGVKKYFNSIESIKNQYEKPNNTKEPNIFIIQQKEEESQTNISMTPDEQPQKNQFTQITPIFYTTNKNPIKRTSFSSNSTNNSTSKKVLNLKSNDDRNKNMLTWKMIADDKNFRKVLNQNNKNKIKRTSIFNNSNIPFSIYKDVDFDLIIENG